MIRRLSSVQIFALGFFIMILTGTLLLLLNWAAYYHISFGEALFTSTSASCVTGLVVKDTASTFTFFGQAVILLLIQIGGLGFMTIAVLFMRLLRRRIGLQEKEVITESLNRFQMNGITSTVRFIIVGTAVIEGSGALLLSFRFIPLFGFGKGLWYALFHAVSAFCNAGFDLMGTFSGPYSSFVYFADDAYVTLILSFLILLGGLGFLVWADLLKCGKRFISWRLHTKVVILVNLVLVAGGTLLFFFLERDGKVPARLLHAFFDSITPRTAGFNTVDTAALSEGGKFLTMILMFIGGSPGSTAGGAKTTTVLVMILYAVSKVRRSRSVSIFRRSIPREALEKAAAVFLHVLGLIVFGILIITLVQPLPLTDVTFEVFSAINTVGMTTGITRELAPVSRAVIILLMYLGRVGSVSFAVALLERKALPQVTYPPEDLPIG